ncbi:hypothetical protein BP5796_13022 [Coleophoma crateriformis]|uniref:Uncharacterized protein n=1 Tax=Coleophoma crateriformis TaxID=565419 RepID=A0A3D8Q542_9HELO|nr:hypothetical protein BP5796_13022 [Coleophoma crateriformis]
MTQVDLYDIESGYWFRQRAFGLDDDMPAGRAALCLALITAPDNSSWNIIMVAGVLTFNGATSRQEIWALSLPTFNWVRLYGQEGALYRHTCHLVGENLLIIGGMERTLPAGDKDVTSCQSSMPARIFSIPLNNYTGKFDYPGSLRPALVPPQVVSMIGGTTTGGASKLSPLVWSDAYLQYVFNPALNRPAYTPSSTYTLATATAISTPTTSPSKIPSSSPSPSVTATPSPGSSHTGAIAGGVVGGVAGLALIGFLAFYFIIRPKRHRADDLRRSELPSYQETKGHPPVEIDDRDNPNRQPRNNDDPPVEMPIPGSPTPAGWHDERVGESGDNLAPLVGDWSENNEGDVWGREAVGVGRGHKRVGSESRFSDISNESGNTASKSVSGSSPPVTPSIPRK